MTRHPLSHVRSSIVDFRTVILRTIPPSRRAGTVVHEATIALVLASAILVTVVQVLALSAQQSRSQHQRLTASHEAGNLMEQLMARSWEQLTPEAVASIELSEMCQTTLRDAQLAIAVTPGSDGAKQLKIEIGWRHASGNQEAPVHLVAWKYPREETDQ